MMSIIWLALDWPLEACCFPSKNCTTFCQSRGGHYGCSLSPVRPWLWSSSASWRLFKNICIWKRKTRRFWASNLKAQLNCKRRIQWLQRGGTAIEWLLWYLARRTLLSVRLLSCYFVWCLLSNALSAEKECCWPVVKFSIPFAVCLLSALQPK